ncbi:MAG TPA: glycosyltransferase family 39 protein, partial [Promineifilum sp.]|nr:glycosyltransferase family 39 protein [Promineifilum sp.]
PVAAAVVAPLPEEEFALPSAPVPVAAPSPASPAGLRAPVAVPARPRPVVVLPEGAALRSVVRALVAGGGLLLALSLWAGRSIPSGQRLADFVLTLIGGLALLLGLQTWTRGQLASWFGRLLVRLAALLRVTPAQAVLLLLALPFAWLTRQASGNGLLAYSATVAIFAWLVAIGLAVAGSVTPRAERPAEVDRPVLGLDRWDIVLSVVLFILALALRAYATDRYPTTYSGDEGSAGLYAVELLTGKANNLFGLGWFSFPTLYFTVQSAAIALFGQTVEAVRLTSAVAGALTVVALYWLGRAMFNRTTALLAALYLAASHFHIHMSRIALNNVWDGLFGTLAILGLWYGWKTGRRLGFILCGLALGLGQYFYISIRPLPILFLIWAAVAFWRQRPLFRERFHGLVLATVIALVAFLPLGLYFVDKPDDFQAPMNRVTIFGPWLEAELARGERTTAEIILDNAINGVLGFTHEPLRLLYNPGSPLLLAGAALLFLLGILWALLNFDLRYLLLLLPLLAVVASNAVSQGAPASQRYVLAMPLVALFVAVPLGEAVLWLRGQYPRYRTAVVVAAFALLALVAAVDIDYYFNRV